MKQKGQSNFSAIQSILDNLPMGVYVLDGKRKIQWVNERVVHRLGREAFHRQGEKYCYYEIFKRVWPCRDCPALKTLKNGLMEHREIKSDYKGETRHYLVTTAPFPDAPDGKGPFIIETVQDITYQKRAEEELKRINDFNAVIIHNAPVAIFTIDTKGRFTSVNPALAAISGLGTEAEEKLLGFNWLENPYTVRCGLADYIRKGLKGESFELQDFPFITYRGKSQNNYLHFRGVPLKNKEGKVEGLLCIIEETTEKVKARMQILQDAKMSAIGRLMTGVAHELNNPLATIAGNSEFASELLQGLQPGSIAKEEILELRGYLDTIADQAFRCKNIINDMIDITKKSGFEAQEIDLAKCLEAILKTANLKKQGILLTKHIDPALPHAEGDPNAVRQCFMNIIENARDALEGRENKIVLIRAYVDGDSVRVDIEDNGAGIHHDIKDRIFEPFFSTKETGRGIGLGLTLCYELLNKMGGNIEVKSSLGSGSLFTVTLPVFPRKVREKNDQGSYRRR